MALAIEPPHPSGDGTGGVDPMLAKPLSATQLTADGLPAGDDLIFEPKWDGFRCLVFKDGDDVRLQSRNRRPFERYVPEIVPILAAQLPDRCVVDGELVVVVDGELAFDALQQRIHPAESRINRLAGETPTSYIAFDLLALDDRDLQAEPFIERRALLEQVLGHVHPPIYLTPATTDRATASDWFHRFEGAGLDGLIVKPPGDPYTPGKRVQLKVKHKRTADCVVAGYRTHKDGEGVGSLLLGIYDDDGNLHHVGVASSFSAKRRKELVDEIADLRLPDDEIETHPWAEWYRADAHWRAAEPPGGAADPAGATSAEPDRGGTERSGVEPTAQPQRAPSRMPGGPSRWNAQKDLSWTALRTDRVVEVAYEAMQNGRLRHSARFERWRPDRDPRTCTYDQFEPPDPVTVDEIFA